MTELIDLSTLASLGQHFSSHEDVTELKGALASVQNDLTIIKSFLLHQYGTEFSNALNNPENYQQEKQFVATKAFKPAEVEMNRDRHADGMDVQKNFSQSKPAQQQQIQRPRPPPLQRFRYSGEGTNTLTGNVTNTNAGNTATATSKTSYPSTAVKSEKFHRNFLSMNSLKFNGGNNQNRFLKTSGSNNSSLKGVAILRNAVNGRSIKVEPQATASGGCTVKKMITAAIPKLEVAYDNGMEDEEFNVSEDAYAAVAVTDGNYDEDGEGGEGYAGYVESGEYQEEADYDGTMAEMMYPEDEDNVYEDYYPMDDGLEANDMVTDQASTTSLVNDGTSVAAKKTQQRRLSHPVIARSKNSEKLDSNNMSGLGESSYLKKCKVCHEEFPSFSLFNHVINSHYKGEVPTCRICKKTFTYKQGLISHMRYHDANKYDKACSYCGKKFIRRSDVVIHERRLHTGERPFQCPVPECNQGFVRRYCLLTHIKTNHGEPLVSQIQTSSS